MSKVMVLGDVHGNTNFATAAVRGSKVLGIKRIVQLGDFGLWDHQKDGVKFLDTLNESLRHNGVKMYVVGGNHENWDRWNWYTEHNPKDFHGFTYLRSHIRIAPKVFSWTWDGKKCLMVGGAVSIDKAWRRKDVSWWPNEVLTWDEVESAMQFSGVDYMFTHDCSNMTPWKTRLKPDLDSQIHRQQMDKVLRSVKPKMHFHGHMHERYEWENMVGDHNGNSVFTSTYGLECDGMYNSWGVLDIDTGEFNWRGKVAKVGWPNREPLFVE